MLREFIHIDQIKSFLEEAFNWWLSYTMSQPVSFDLAILACFLLQYFGGNGIQNFSEILKTNLLNFMNEAKYFVKKETEVSSGLN